jgi:hypothetical protein
MKNNIKLTEEIAFYYKNDKKLLIVYPIRIYLENNLLLATFSKFNANLNSIFYFKMYSNSIEKIDEKEIYAFDIEHIEEFTDYSLTDAFDKYSTCEGCRYGYANQLGHMEEGGCLHLNL